MMNIKLSYQTQLLPPPYAYAAVFDMEIGDTIQMAFEMEYMDREALSVEEIEAEGFSVNDDFQWKGTLATHWKVALEDLASHPHAPEPDEAFYIHLFMDGEDKGFISDEHNLIVQELLQAVFEASKREAPLVVQLNAEKRKESVEWRFAERRILLDGVSKLDWDAGRRLMEHVFSLDFDQMSPSDQPKEKSIGFGDGGWYPVENEKWWKEWRRLQAMILK